MVTGSVTGPFGVTDTFGVIDALGVTGISGVTRACWGRSRGSWGQGLVLTGMYWWGLGAGDLQCIEEKRKRTRETFLSLIHI